MTATATRQAIHIRPIEEMRSLVFGVLASSAVIFAAISPVWAQPLSALDGKARPLSAIDWLDGRAALEPLPTAAPPLSPSENKTLAPKPKTPDEPATAQSITGFEITVSPLSGAAPRQLGLAPSRLTGLPSTMWSRSDGATLAHQISQLPRFSQSSLQKFALLLLVAETDPAQTSPTALDLARVAKLLDYGAVDPAYALMTQIGGTHSAQHAALFFDLAILTDQSQQACSLAMARPDLLSSSPHQIYCTARAGRWDDAVLLLGTSRALGDLTSPYLPALERFLDPDLFEDEAPLPAPDFVEPLLFELYAAQGEALPSAGRPLAYAAQELSPIFGWKTRLDAAERLAAANVLASNQLLGLYSERRAAASGSVWDRVRALQRFETALETGNPTAINRSLASFWEEMRAAGLATAMAEIFAPRLIEADIASMVTGKAAQSAFEMMLLSPDYERAPQLLPDLALEHGALTALALGTPAAKPLANERENALLLAFNDAPSANAAALADVELLSLARSDRLGEALLSAIVLIDSGVPGDLPRLTRGLATLRALGAEDLARRAALEILILSEM